MAELPRDTTLNTGKGGGGVGGGPSEQLHSDAMQQRTTSEWNGEVGGVAGQM